MVGQNKIDLLIPKGRNWKQERGDRSQTSPKLSKAHLVTHLVHNRHVLQCKIFKFSYRLYLHQ